MRWFIENYYNLTVANDKKINMEVKSTGLNLQGLILLNGVKRSMCLLSYK